MAAIRQPDFFSLKKSIMINVVSTGYMKWIVVATPLAINLYPQNRNTADIK